MGSSGMHGIGVNYGRAILKMLQQPQTASSEPAPRIGGIGLMVAALFIGDGQWIINRLFEMAYQYTL
jgi:hypothetical protein